MAAFDGFFAVRCFEGQADGCAGLGDLPHRRVGVERNAVALERSQHDIDAFGVFIAEHAVRLDKGHGGAKAPVGLRKFNARGAGADDKQKFGAGFEIEDICGVEYRHAVEAGDQRIGRRGAGRDDITRGLDGGVANRDCIRVGEAGRADDDLHAEAAQPLRGIIRRDGGDHALHVSAGFGVVRKAP